MLGLKPYVMFNGNCEEAMNYYKDKLKGEILSLMRFEDSPMDTPKEFKKKVMHSQFKFEECEFMASDAMPQGNVTVGNNISLSVGVNDVKKIEMWFNSLAADGKVTMPLQDTFWGAKFGMLTDKFGINWMFNCELNKK